MWTCKHCKFVFNFNTTSEKANHSRWCKDNPKRNDTSGLKLGHKKSLECRLGPLKLFEVECKKCNKQFSVKERANKFPSKEKYFCSKSCAASQGGIARSLKYKNRDDKDLHYTNICWKYNDKKCVCCDEKRIVAVHHLNENHSDNDPKNLIPLCPTHHQYWHSRYRYIVEETISKWHKNRWPND